MRNNLALQRGAVRRAIGESLTTPLAQVPPNGLPN